MTAPARSVAVQPLLDRLAREEQQLKNLGLHAQAAGLRLAVTILLREADAAQDLTEQPSQR